MMAAIGSDGIDPSQFLPRNASVVNRFRNAHGDLDGEIETRQIDGKPEKVVTHAKVKDETIAADLIRRGFLEEMHRYYAYSLLELRHAFAAPTRHKINSVFLAEVLGEGVSSAQAGKTYDEVTREMTLHRIRIIEDACTLPALEDAACKVIAGINAYQDCFERLVVALDGARARRKAERENALANDPMFR